VVAAAVADVDFTGSTAGDDFTTDVVENGFPYAHVTSAQVPAGTTLSADWNLPAGANYCTVAAAFPSLP
jgi:hypothetical protein